MKMTQNTVNNVFLFNIRQAHQTCKGTKKNKKKHWLKFLGVILKLSWNCLDIFLWRFFQFVLGM